MQKRLIIYDVDAPDGQEFFPADGDTLAFPAAPAVHHCIGCFGCWTKTPGKCVIKDRACVLPAWIAQCGELILVSPILYGGYSRNVKAALDRSIGYLLPYFRIVNGEMHHQMRHENPFKLTACFYGPCSGEEREIAGRLVRANAVNFGAGSCSVTFFDTAQALREAVL